ncbi:MAG: hypothetical protein PHR99_00130 [Methanobacteriales archaeon]|nr:hypothetical protein [Methanobacteriales archaeon]
MLAYKAENAGKRAVKVNPKGTSKGLTPNNQYQDPHIRHQNTRLGAGTAPKPAKNPLLSIPCFGRGCWASFIIETGNPSHHGGVVHQ